MSREVREQVSVDQFNTKISKKTKVDSVESYDVNGNYIDPFSPFCIAKEVQNRHYIKRLRTLGEYRLFNVLEDNVKELDTTYGDTGRNKWEFVSVPQESYENYVSFIKSRKPVFLKHAERLST